jgi:hypothetical protein
LRLFAAIQNPREMSEAAEQQHKSSTVVRGGRERLSAHADVAAGTAFLP